MARQSKSLTRHANGLYVKLLAERKSEIEAEQGYNKLVKQYIPNPKACDIYALGKVVLLVNRFSSHKTKRISHSENGSVRLDNGYAQIASRIARHRRYHQSSCPSSGDPKTTKNSLQQNNTLICRQKLNRSRLTQVTLRTSSGISMNCNPMIQIDPTIQLNPNY